jgi:hypothetical protein
VLAEPSDVDGAVAAATAAYADWSQASLSRRTKVLFAFRELVNARTDQLAEIVSDEHGKVFSDARGEVQRGLEVVEFACGLPTLLKGDYSDQVSGGVDLYSIREPLGVCAGITPFNFPAMVPMWMHPVAIACGNLTGGVTRLGRILAEEHGVRLAFHPHADTHVGTQPQVERFLADTDPDWVSLCLDTGHISYYGGDNLELIRRYPERIGYVHLKQVDPAVTRRVAEDGISLAEAVREGVMVEPPTGVPEFEPVIPALAGLDTDLFAIVEQDLYPCAFDVPLPIAGRTRDYLRRCGLGAAGS